MRYRKNLRNDCTSAEAALWICLKKSKLLGRKFRRQHSIEKFIVDFYCPSEKIIIELDGGVHFTQSAQEADKRRDQRLQELGFKVLRFENEKVFEHLDLVLEEIKRNFASPCKGGAD